LTPLRRSRRGARGGNEKDPADVNRPGLFTFTAAVYALLCDKFGAYFKRQPPRLG
jgi:hypothetical protein